MWEAGASVHQTPWPTNRRGVYIEPLTGQASTLGGAFGAALKMGEGTFYGGRAFCLFDTADLL